MRIYIAADHAGFNLKQELSVFLRKEGHEAEDCGAFEYDANDDYPPMIARAARKLSEDAQRKKMSRAIVIGASGQGEAMVANRFRGVRCALYYGPSFAKAPDGQWKPAEQIDMSGKNLGMLASVREHNDANALSLGARFISSEEAKQVVRKWLETEFSGEERHARRIKMIDNIS